MAEDVLQEAYLRVLDGRAKFGGRSAPRTWFFGVIRRVAHEQRRTIARRGALDLKLAAEPPVDSDATGLDVPQRARHLDEQAAQLRGALGRLPERQRDVLHLVFYGELTLEEAAQVLAISVGSARTHYKRGKRRLAQWLELGAFGEQESTRNNLDKAND